MYFLWRQLIAQKYFMENLPSKFYLFLLLLDSGKILNIWLELIFISEFNFFFLAISSPAISSMTIQYAQLQALYLQWSQSPNLLMNWYWLYFLQAGDASESSYLIFKMSRDEFSLLQKCQKKSIKKSNWFNNTWF